MLLKEQGTLQTPVGLFSSKHEVATHEPEQAKFYKQLIPLSKPGAGEQYAFKVDMDKCTGCKACVSACHSLNGLEEDETWRDVGSIHGGTSDAPYAQTVTTACHHCADPGCLNGCPVLAYEKDPETGIVHHLDDQCIGCQYCVLKCPYDVPKYSKSLGIVRKCDMCHGRLAEGEAPACVQACPTEAISITIVDTSKTIEAAKSSQSFLPSAPNPDYTIPTTQYVTEKEFPEVVEAGDLHELKPEHAHFSLVFMLVLMQLSTGFYLAASFLSGGHSSAALVGGFIAMVLGLAAATSHLGRPLGAWRAFLGLRRSWLSREIVVFGAYSGVAALYTASAFIEPLKTFGFLAGVGTLAIGLLGTYCSAMIYHDTQRPFWRLPVGAGKFFGTLLGLALVSAVMLQAYAGVANRIFVLATLVVLAGKLFLEATQFSVAKEAGMSPARKSALLMLRPLRVLTLTRFIVSISGLVLLSMLLANPSSFPVALIASCALLAGEFLERTLFFKAVAAPKMPGGLSS